MEYMPIQSASENINIHRSSLEFEALGSEVNKINHPGLCTSLQTCNTGEKDLEAITISSLVEIPSLISI